MDYIFSRLQANDPTGNSTEVACSYVEIYNEKVYDLLNYENSRALKSGLEVQTHPDKGVSVQGAVEVGVETTRDVLDVLWRGARNRAISATDMNLHSSRSHTIFQVAIQRRQASNAVVRSKVWQPQRIVLLDFISFPAPFLLLRLTLLTWQGQKNGGLINFPRSLRIGLRK